MLHLADAFLHLWRSSVSTDWHACEYACTQMSRPTAPRANQSASPMLRLLPSHTGRPPPMTRMRRRLRSLGSRGSGVGSRVSRERAVSRQMEYGLRGRSFQDRRAAALAPSTQERLDVRDMPMRRDDQTEERAKRSCTAGESSGQQQRRHAKHDTVHGTVMVGRLRSGFRRVVQGSARRPQRSHATLDLKLTQRVSVWISFLGVRVSCEADVRRWSPRACRSDQCSLRSCSREGRIEGA